MEPPAPPVEAPVCSASEPEAPALAVPDRRVTAPLTPAGPALGDSIVAGPLVEDRPTPLVRRMAPPVFRSPAPPSTTTAPPLPS